MTDTSSKKQTQAQDDFPVNLPQTQFPMRAQLAQREPDMLALWLKDGHYDELRKICQSRNSEYRFHDGPPYANGEIHIGHALNKVLKDMVVRSQLLDGHASKFVPGWDCHGLPIELQVERRWKGDKRDRLAFQKACREYALEQIEQQKASFSRLGLVSDFKDIYLTMDPKVEAATIESVGTLVERGLVIRRRMPVLWCSKCRSSLAEAETEYQNLTSPAIYLAFPVADVAQAGKAFGLQLPVQETKVGSIAMVAWTTTPWTVFANRALAVGEDFSYSLVRFAGDSRCYILASALVKQAAEIMGRQAPKVLATTAGKKLLRLVCKHPFYDRQAQVLPSPYVTEEAGTGVVHTAPSHGREDYEVCLKHGVEMDDLVDHRARFRREVAEAADMTTAQASQQSMAMLAEAGNLLHSYDYEHSYPTCWRHKSPLIYRATWQWFIELFQSGVIDRARNHVEKVAWFPETGRERMLAMLTNRPDWCISRQRSWGVPLPFFIHADTGELHPHSGDMLAQLVERVRNEGIECWNHIELRDLYPQASDEEVAIYQKTNDVLDVWFDSGNTYRSVGGGVVNDMYLEGIDQFRGWFQAALILSTALDDRAPYRNILTHGFMVDAKGEKMSKSRGNITRPHEITEKFGADVLRLWVASADTRGEIVFNDEVLKHVVDRYRRLRNTLRFLLGNLYDFDPAKHRIGREDMLLLDRWVISRATELEARVIGEFRKYSYHTASRLLHELAVDLGGSYFDVIKDRLYCSGTDSPARRSAQTAMYLLGEVVVRLLSVAAPFTAQEVWECLPARRTKNVMSAEFVKLAEQSEPGSWLGDEEVALFADILEPLRAAVFQKIETARNDKVIDMPLAANVRLGLNRRDYDLLAPFADELHYYFVVSNVSLELADQAEKPEIQIAPAEGTKCPRCRLTVGEQDIAEDHPCSRCRANVAGDFEKRLRF